MQQPFTLASSLLRGGSYDPDAQELRLTFKSGQTWAYAGVPQDEVDALTSASSAGAYFLASIKGSYPERRV